MATVKGSIANWRGSGEERNPATNQYKGLVSFIADLRAARAREVEEKRVNKELANIRQKFKEGKLQSYDKKKYTLKLLYVYILGWNLDFGHLEAVNMISATKFSEKQIGYLAVTLFFHEEHELLHLVVNSIRKDLLDHSEINNCLALHAIANVGGRAMGEALGSDVHRLLISPASSTFVKKKAALTLLRLYRKHPSIVQPDWAERIIALMDDPDMGVALSVTSLVMALAQDDPEQYRGSYVKAANRLRKMVLGNDCSEGYRYYGVPCPWIQVKFLRLMQYYPPSNYSHTRNLIRDSVQKILDDAVEKSSNVQQNNALNAVLFEAIKLVIHLDTEESLMIQMSSKLGKFIIGKETNVRYLGLEAMTHLASRGETQDSIKTHQNNIVALLRDRDITVRRQALDLLYSMCDQSNAQSIVAELLRYLQSADYAIREEMVLKIAVLAERYATDALWYVDIALRLLAMAGDQVSQEVWQRVVQIVTNNEDLQDYACKHLLRYIKTDQCHESLIKIGAYLLGEFGHLIADSEGGSPIEQFVTLRDKLSGSSTESRCIILSCFIKFVNLFPEIKQHVMQVLYTYADVLDPELQQRACEYVALANEPTDDLLRTVFDEMPPFPERASALLSRIHSKRSGVSDKRAMAGGKEEPMLNRSLTTLRTGQHGSIASGSLNNSASHVDVLASPGAAETMMGSNGANRSQDLAGLEMNLNGLDLTAASPTATVAPWAGTVHLSPGWEAGYNKLLLRAEGVLYEDAQIQVGVRSEYRQHIGCIILYFQNKSSFSIGSFTTTLDNRSPSALKPDTKSLPDTTLASQAQSQQTIMFEAREAFADAPTLRISYLAGALQALTLQLPVALHKYMEPANLGSEDFFKRWKQIGGPPREAQAVFRLPSGSQLTTGSIKKILQGFNWGLLENVDANSQNFVGATVLHTGRGGKYGCLMRLEPNYQTMMYRLTIRATVDSVPSILLRAMQDRLALGD